MTIPMTYNQMIKVVREQGATEYRKIEQDYMFYRVAESVPNAFAYRSAIEIEVNGMFSFLDDWRLLGEIPEREKNLQIENIVLVNE